MGHGRAVCGPWVGCRWAVDGPKAIGNISGESRYILTIGFPKLVHSKVCPLSIHKASKEQFSISSICPDISITKLSLSGLWVGLGQWTYSPHVLSLTWVCPIQSLSSFCPLWGWLGCKGENKSFKFLSRDCPLIFWWCLGNSEDKYRTKVWLEHFHRDKSWIWWGH